MLGAMVQAGRGLRAAVSMHAMLDAPPVPAHVNINGCVPTCRAIRVCLRTLPGAMPASRSACLLSPVVWSIAEALPTAC